LALRPLPRTAKPPAAAAAAAAAAEGHAPTQYCWFRQELLHCMYPAAAGKMPTLYACKQECREGPRARL
jgi:hypothetical protein